VLVLTRKKGQGVVIGGGIRVVVVEVSGEYVRLGIEAPREVAVYREEIYKMIQEENRAALATRRLADELEDQTRKYKELRWTPLSRHDF